ncbi:MAG: lipoyl(octanoyl) transferase LipB [Anaerolineales bacterium]|jgi:lipoate-protein ligase B|nr:lipoyl(octanoyl) transferase LipB [Anaerolineales bacterium]
MNLLNIRDLGQIDYQSAWDLQNELAGEVAAGRQPATLLLLEHPHTFTFGRRGQAANLLWNEPELARRGVSVYWVDRGGDVTYHGPGQLVGYPILKLADRDHVGYLRKLEQALIVSLARLGLVAGQLAGLSGVWVQPEIASRCGRCQPSQRGKPAKIAAIGVKVDANNVTRHGFALNVCPQMDYFNGIIPCGIPDHATVSMAELLADPPEMERVKSEVARAFSETFDFFS